jgi:Ras-related protein Rab-5C
MSGIRQPGYKLVLLGDASVGKTSLVGRFVNNAFNEAVETTVGAAFSTQSVKAPETGRMIKFEIWDTAGQERFKSLAPMYYRNASAAVVVFDVSSDVSFTRAKDWVKQLALSNNPDIVIALAANKSDLPNAQRQVKLEDARNFAQSEKLIYMETSAKNGNNVSKLFEVIANKLPETPFTPASLGGIGSSTGSTAGGSRTTSITLGSNDKPATSTSRCCGGQ